MRKRAVPGLLSALIVVMLLIQAVPPTLAAVPPQPLPCTSWAITNETWMDDAGWFDPVDGDDLTVNRGGIVHMPWNWSGSDGSVRFNGITVNAGGVFVQENGTTIYGMDGVQFTINEGGMARAMGTSGSHCTIRASATTDTWYVAVLNGGKFYAQYTDITSQYGGIFDNTGSFVGIYNCNISVN